MFIEHFEHFESFTSIQFKYGKTGRILIEYSIQVYFRSVVIEYVKTFVAANVARADPCSSEFGPEYLAFLAGFSRSFRQAANTLDTLWKFEKQAHAAGTSIGIVGGLLTIGGGIATMMSAGAATPLLLLGTGVGVTGASTNLVTSYLEASTNSVEITRAEEEGKKISDDINRLKSTVQSLLDNTESARLLFRLLAEQHSGPELTSFARRLIPSLVTRCTALQQSAAKTEANAVAKAGAQAVDDVAQATA